MIRLDQLYLRHSKLLYVTFSLPIIHICYLCHFKMVMITANIILYLQQSKTSIEYRCATSQLNTSRLNFKKFFLLSHRQFIFYIGLVQPQWNCCELFFLSVMHTEYKFLIRKQRDIQNWTKQTNNYNENMAVK